MHFRLASSTGVPQRRPGQLEVWGNAHPESNSFLFLSSGAAHFNFWVCFNSQGQVTEHWARILVLRRLTHIRVPSPRVFWGAYEPRQHLLQRYQKTRCSCVCVHQQTIFHEAVIIPPGYADTFLFLLLIDGLRSACISVFRPGLPCPRLAAGDTDPDTGRVCSPSPLRLLGLQACVCVCVCGWVDGTLRADNRLAFASLPPAYSLIATPVDFAIGLLLFHQRKCDRPPDRG